MKTTNIPQNTDVGTLVSKACAEVHGFDEMYRRLERRMNTQRRSASTNKMFLFILLKAKVLQNLLIWQGDFCLLIKAWKAKPRLKFCLLLLSHKLK